MNEDAYRTPATTAEMDRHDRTIRNTSLSVLAVTGAAFGAAYVALPTVLDFPENLAERLAFAAQAGMFVLLWVLVGVMMVSLGRRYSAADIGGSAAGPPSPELAVKVAFLQNTLEQAVLAFGAYLALASLLGGAWLALIAVSVVLFAVGRILFYAGYRKGARGRALGMVLTMMPTIVLYMLVIGAMVARLV